MSYQPLSNQQQQQGPKVVQVVAVQNVYVEPVQQPAFIVHNVPPMQQPQMVNPYGQQQPAVVPVYTNQGVQQNQYGQQQQVQQVYIPEQQPQYGVGYQGQPQPRQQTQYAAYQPVHFQQNNIYVKQEERKQQRQPVYGGPAIIYVGGSPGCNCCVYRSTDSCCKKICDFLFYLIISPCQLLFMFFKCCFGICSKTFFEENCIPCCTSLMNFFSTCCGNVGGWCNALSNACTHFCDGDSLGQYSSKTINCCESLILRCGDFCRECCNSNFMQEVGSSVHSGVEYTQGYCGNICSRIGECCINTCTTETVGKVGANLTAGGEVITGFCHKCCVGCGSIFSQCCTCSNVDKVGDAVSGGYEKVSGCCVSCLSSAGSICKDCCNMGTLSKVGEGIAGGAEKAAGCCSNFCTCCCSSSTFSKIGDEAGKQFENIVGCCGKCCNSVGDTCKCCCSEEIISKAGDGAELITENIQKCCCCLIKSISTVGGAVIEKVGDLL